MHFLARDSIYLGFARSLYRERWTFLDGLLVRAYHADLSLVLAGCHMLAQSIALFTMPGGAATALACLMTSAAISASSMVTRPCGVPNGRRATSFEVVGMHGRALFDDELLDFLRICRAAESAPVSRLGTDELVPCRIEIIVFGDHADGRIIYQRHGRKTKPFHSTLKSSEKSQDTPAICAQIVTHRSMTPRPPSRLHVQLVAHLVALSIEAGHILMR